MIGYIFIKIVLVANIRAIFSNPNNHANEQTAGDFFCNQNCLSELTNNIVVTIKYKTSAIETSDYHLSSWSS